MRLYLHALVWMICLQKLSLDIHWAFLPLPLVPAFMASSLQECSFPILSAFVTPVLASQLHAQLVDSSACRSMQTSPNWFCIQHSKVFVFLVIYTQLQCKSGFAKSHFLPVAFRNQKE